MSSEEAPWTVDRAFIEAVLRRADADPDLHVTAVEVEDAVGKGENYASVLVRVAVAYTTPSTPGVATRSLVVKTPPRGELMQNFVRRARFFAKEAHMYEATLPAMRALLGGSVALAPSVLRNDRADTIVLEDLRPLGFKMADRRQGLDLAHCMVAVRALATLHAASLALHDADPRSMDAYPETFYCEANRRMLTNHLDGTFTSLAAEVATWHGFERFAPKLRALAPCAVDRACAVVGGGDADLRVLNHGDFWTNNMMFGYDADGRVDAVRMVDFQMARWASPALDLHYFLYTSPRQSVLEAHRDEIVVEYQEALTGALRTLGLGLGVGVGVGVGVTLEQVRAELDAKVFYAFITSVMYSIMVADKEEVPDLSVLTEANADDKSSKTLDKSRSGKIFREAFQRRLPWFEQQGLFDQDAS